TKVYFPRLLIPFGAIGAVALDFMVGSVVLAIMMAVKGIAPGWNVLLAPLLILALVLTAAGVGTLLAALTVAYRDFRHVVPFSIQLWMFATPTIYMQADAKISAPWNLLLPFNPAHGFIYNFRQAMFGKELDWYALAVSSTVS